MVEMNSEEHTHTQRNGMNNGVFITLGMTAYIKSNDKGAQKSTELLPCEGM